jgi:DNA-binding XRE family transcriptional regulator
MKSEWRVIKEAPNYEVSNLGGVRCLVDSHQRKRRIPRPLKPYITKVGYPMVTLKAGGKRLYRYVHTLILEAFSGPRPAKYQAAHLNGVRADSRLDNLRWVSCKENLSHRIGHGTLNSGSRNGMAKLSEEDVLNIKKIRKENGLTYAAIAKLFGVTDSTIENIVSGRRWAHV